LFQILLKNKAKMFGSITNFFIESYFAFPERKRSKKEQRFDITSHLKQRRKGKEGAPSIEKIPAKAGMLVKPRMPAKT
jgi:hypothetical protein